MAGAGAVLGWLSPGWGAGMGPGWSQRVSTAPVLKPIGRNWTLWHPDYMLNLVVLLRIRVLRISSLI